jgi:hypothetical protein
MYEIPKEIQKGLKWLTFNTHCNKKKGNKDNYNINIFANFSHIFSLVHSRNKMWFYRFIIYKLYHLLIYIK